MARCSSVSQDYTRYVTMRLRGARNVARMGNERNASLKLVRIFKGKILLGRFRSRWDNIIKST
jgi:hypothetical protein